MFCKRIEINLDFFRKIINIDQRDILLLKMYFSDKVSPEDTANLLSQYDIENESFGFNFLFSQTVKKHPEMQLPQDILPRIHGVATWFRYKNINFFMGFAKIAKLFEKNNIPVLIIKGLCFKYLYPQYSRFMDDIDFCVPENLFEQAIDIAVKSGWHIKWDAGHSYDLVLGKSNIDIHRRIVKSYCDIKSLNEAIFKRAKKVTAFGSSVLIPSSSDILFIQLSNAYDNIVSLKEYPSTFMWLFDCINIIKDNKDIDWNIIKENIKLADFSCRIKIMLGLLNDIYPNIVPNEIISSIETTNSNYKDFERRTKSLIITARCLKTKIRIKDLWIKQNRTFSDLLKIFALSINFLYYKFFDRIKPVQYLTSNFIIKRIIKLEIKKRYL